jgi:nucleoside-diphosphate-sugar epimerase
MKVFVTGGSGFVGRHLLLRLRSEGHTVVALARTSRTADAISRCGVQPWRGKPSDHTSLIQVLGECGAVVHAAARRKFWGSRDEFETDNITLTKTMLDAAQSAGVGSFVHISAASVVMHARGPMLGVDECAPLVNLPELPYSSTKARAERLVVQAASPALRTVALRPPFIWGSGDAVDGELGEAIRQGRFGWFSGGRYAYATCHVANLAEAVVRAINTPASGKALFIADGEPIELRSILERRIMAAGLKVPRASIPTPLAWAMARTLEFVWRKLRLTTDPAFVRETVRLMGYPFTVNINAARQHIGYQPLVSIDEGLRELAQRRKGDCI